MRVRGWRGIALGAALVMLLSGCDWTMFGYDVVHSRFSPETTITTANAASLVPKWSAVTGGAVDSSPSVVNGVLYVGSSDNKLYAFDALGQKNCSGMPTRCAPLWTGLTAGAVESSPAVVNGVVFVGSDDDKLYAFDANGDKDCSGTPKTCAPLWTGLTSGAVESSPAVVNDVVYVGADNWNVNSSDPQNSLYAFDANGDNNCSGTPKTCAPLWTGAVATGITKSSPAVSNGVVYVGAAAAENLGQFGGFVLGFLVAFDAGGNKNCSGTPKTCAPLWYTPGTSGPSDSSPAVANGMVYIGSHFDQNLYVYDAKGTGCATGPNLQSCSPQFVGHTGGPIDSSPAVANGTAYVGSDDGKLYAFGSRNWTAITGGSVSSSPAVANGVVYIGSTAGTLLAFNANTGAQLWTARTSGPINSSPAIANAMIYIGSNDGSVHAYGLP
jgi:outer membrane protein assembly factor BamB